VHLRSCCCQRGKRGEGVRAFSYRRCSESKKKTTVAKEEGWKGAEGEKKKRPVYSHFSNHEKKKRGGKKPDPPLQPVPKKSFRSKEREGKKRRTPVLTNPKESGSCGYFCCNRLEGVPFQEKERGKKRTKKITHGVALEELPKKRRPGGVPDRLASPARQTA